MLGKQVLMGPGEGFHLRRLQDAARALGEITEVHSGTPYKFPPVKRRGECSRGPPHARPLALLLKWDVLRQIQVDISRAKLGISEYLAPARAVRDALGRFRDERAD